MPPGQKTVQILEFGIKLIIPFRPDAHQMEPDAGNLADSLRQRTNSGRSGHQLAVAYAQFPQSRPYARVRIHSGDNQRAEVVALAALINAEVGRTRLFCLFLRYGQKAGYLRFQDEFDKLIRPFTLHEKLVLFFIHCH